MVQNPNIPHSPAFDKDPRDVAQWFRELSKDLILRAKDLEQAATNLEYFGKKYRKLEVYHQDICRENKRLRKKLKKQRDARRKSNASSRL